MSWFSTALLDALKSSFLPVLITTGSEQNIADIVFPLDKIAIKWPEEKSKLELFLQEPLFCYTFLMKQQRLAFA